MRPILVYKDRLITFGGQAIFAISIHICMSVPYVIGLRDTKQKNSNCHNVYIYTLILRRVVITIVAEEKK